MLVEKFWEEDFLTLGDVFEKLWSKFWGDLRNAEFRKVQCQNGRHVVSVHSAEALLKNLGEGDVRDKDVL